MIETKGAVISECGKYRYRLWRIWNDKLPKALFVMLNPSTADANTDDATIRRLRGFSQRMGCGGFYVGNLYPYRATDPNELRVVGFEVAAREENWQHLRDMMNVCAIKILAHGNSPIEKPNITSNGEDRDWYCFGITKSGNPVHPLYLKSDAPLVLLHEL